MKNCVSAIMTLDEIKDKVDKLQSIYDPKLILKKAEARLDSLKEGESIGSVKDALFKAMSLSEFKNGHLLISIVPEQYKTFAIDMLRNLQAENTCSTTSERATAEVTVLAFVRVLEVQRRLDNYLERDNLKQIDIAYFSVLSKELDRSHRHYFAAIQALRMLRQPSLKVNIKVNTAIIGQNQILQEEQNVNPI